MTYDLRINNVHCLNECVYHPMCGLWELLLYLPNTSLLTLLCGMNLDYHFIELSSCGDIAVDL